MYFTLNGELWFIGFVNIKCRPIETNLIHKIKTEINLFPLEQASQLLLILFVIEQILETFVNQFYNN